jgi:sRNA-binding carbon storage regulator CsrA
VKGQLVLTRRPLPNQDTVYVDDNLEIKVTRAQGGEVRLAFRSLNGTHQNIMRGEIYVPRKR